MAKKAKSSTPTAGDNSRAVARAEFRGSVVVARGGFRFQLAKYQSAKAAGLTEAALHDDFEIAHMAGYLADPTGKGAGVSNVEAGATLVDKFEKEAIRIRGLKNCPPKGGTDEHRTPEQQRAYNAARSAWSYLRKTAEGTNKHQKKKAARAARAATEAAAKADATRAEVEANHLPLPFTGKEAVPSIKSSTEWHGFYSGLAAIIGRTLKQNQGVPQRTYFGLGERILELIKAAEAEEAADMQPKPRTSRGK